MAAQICQGNADDSTKCDEIVINILVNDKDIALTITVKASKGRILKRKVVLSKNGERNNLHVYAPWSMSHVIHGMSNLLNPSPI